MLRRVKKLTLERQLFLSFVAFSTVLLLLTLGLALYLDVTRQLRAVDETIRSTADYIASLDTVEEMLVQGYPDPEVMDQLDALSASMRDLNAIAVYDTQGLRFYHTDRQEWGETFVEGDQDPVLQGSGPYITTGYSTHGLQRRAFQAVTDGEGKILGFVMTSILTSGIRERLQGLFVYFLAIFCGALLVAMALSRGIVALLRRSLRGHHPDELLDLYLQQGDVLNAIQDGLVATDPRGTVIFSNQAAQGLFQLEEGDLLGDKLERVFPQSSCVQAARTGVAVRNRSCVIRDRQVLASEVPIPGPAGGCSGVLNIFHDKTEMLKLSDELSGIRYTLDTLRFFNHEFMNKLHIILGYLQTGETDRAISFIMNSSLVSSQAIRETADCIRASRICALVIGKMMHAAELGIRLTLAPDSYCLREDLLLPEQDYVTLIGNLLENAIEELSRGSAPVKEVRLALYCRPDCSVILCEDTGGGIPPELQPHIFEKGVSSKGTGRGLGLCLVQQIVEDHGGTIDVTTEAGAGTCFTLTFTKREA